MHSPHIAPICAVQGSFAGHYGLGLDLGHGVDTDGGIGILATVAAMPADWGGAANDNPAPRDQFFYLLDLGLDPADLGSDLRGIVGDPKRLFLDRLSNIYWSLRALKPPGWGQLDRKGCLSAAQTPHDHEFEERRTRANAMPLEHIMAKCGWKLRRVDELKGACPFCGEGDDRLYVRRDNSWGRRRCGAEQRHGNDSIGMYRLLHGGCSFRMALDVLAPPLGSGTQKAKAKSGGGGAGAKASGTASAPGKDDAAANATPGEFPPRTPPDEKGEPLFLVAGEEGPKRAKNELRRHVYYRGGGGADVLAAVPVRVKIKYSKRDGKAGWVNWYRVVDKGGAGAIGWQRGKPKTGYVDVPYVTLGSNPFDPDVAGDRLFWTEGEKDTDTITKMGGLAFTFGGGEGHTAGVEAWAIEKLDGRSVVIPADNDAAGRKQAQAKASARKIGAKSVIEFKDVPEGEDVSWAHENRSLDMEELDAMSDAAPEWIGVVNGGAGGGSAGSTVFGDKAPDSTTWKTEAMRNPKTGAMLNNVTNVLLALEAMFPKKFTWDEFACCVKIDRGRMVVETDVIELQILLQKEGLASVGKEAIYDALSVRAKYNSYYPIREEIESVEWDDVSRVNRFAADYLGCEKTDYTVTVGRMFLISMVARVYDPGCQCDYMLILEGPQGEIKSSAVRALASKRFFSSSLPDITTKDSSQHMRDKWLIEIGEMHRFDGTRGANQLKDFLTRRTEKYRPPYGRLETTEPRQCVFIGTINRIGGAGYLKDPRSAGREAIGGDHVMRSSSSVGIEAAFRVPCRMRRERKVFFGRRDDRTETLEAAGAVTQRGIQQCRVAH
jgi:Virulence-associated protein E